MEMSPAPVSLAASALPPSFDLPSPSSAVIDSASDAAPSVTAARSESAIDSALVQRFNNGDETAFVEIVTRYREKILGIALQFLRNHADAEEIAQDTFIRAHRGLARFRGDSSLSTWLHRITVNLARNRYWYFFRRRRHLSLSLDCPLGLDSTDTFADLVATSDADPARQASVDEFDVMVSTCMQNLEASQLEILTLRNLLHHSYDEIARTLGINEGTVKSRIARARGKLRELIATTYPEFPIDGAPSDWFEPVRGAARLH